MSENASASLARISERKLSFVLPITLHEVVTSGKRPSWRHSPDYGAINRYELLINSFMAHFKMDELCEFLIICPSRDVPAISEHLVSVTQDPRFRVLSETDLHLDLVSIFDKGHGEKPLAGWVTQQIIKLAASAYVKSDFYVTLDSDIICIRPFGFDSLVVNGMSLVNRESYQDYLALYISNFAQVEVYRKTVRYRTSAAILGYVRSRSLDGVFYGETPVILHRQTVNDLKMWLSARFKRPWYQGLSTQEGWSEYSLYFQFLEMTGELHSKCILAGCNTVLDLKRSVWQESQYYRSKRNYDERHFMAAEKGDGGPFVAVQSWLSPTSWLPPRFNGVDEFYDEVNAWLLGHVSTN